MGICPTYANLDIGTVGKKQDIRALRKKKEETWASLVAELVKNPAAMRETWVQSPGWEDPLENGKATYSSIQAWRISRTV